MITKFSQSWRLFKASVATTWQHRKLLWFPVLSTFLTGLIALFFLAPLVLPVVLHPTGYRLNQKAHWVALRDYYLPKGATQPGRNIPVSTPSLLHEIFIDILSRSAPENKSAHPDLASASAGGDQPAQRQPAHISPLVPLYLVLLYFTSMFLATFFNVAFYSEIISALNGGNVSFRRGLALAWSRWPSILAWSLLAGVVGWVIHKLQERLPFVGRLITGLIGITWSVAAVFVIPVIIQEQPMRNPLKILRKSALTLKQAWGEGLIGYVGFFAGNVMIFVGWLLMFPLLLVLGRALHFHFWVGGAVGLLWVIGLVALFYISGVASHVYRCALYIYASEGAVPEPYDKDLLDMAWKVKGV